MPTRNPVTLELPPDSDEVLLNFPAVAAAVDLTPGALRDRIASGRPFPRHDVVIGQRYFWRASTVRRFILSGDLNTKSDAPRMKRRPRRAAAPVDTTAT